jgi:hypothetical protein
MTRVSDNPENSRYEIRIDGVLAGISEYVDRGEVRVFRHTEVLEGFAGQGLAATLVTEALEDVRAAGGLIRPLCPYVAAFLRKHPEFQDLVG